MEEVYDVEIKVNVGLFEAFKTQRILGTVCKKARNLRNISKGDWEIEIIRESNRKRSNFSIVAQDMDKGQWEEIMKIIRDEIQFNFKNYMGPKTTKRMVEKEKDELFNTD